jgi:tetratricopeptide (TPR) repeat protein
MVLALLALLASQELPGPAVREPRAIARRAILAIEGDSAVPLSRRWSAESRTDGSTPGPVLGLAHLARLSYDYPAAESLFLRIVSETQAGEWSVAARLGLAASAAAQGNFSRADMLYAAAEVEAAQIGDRESRAEALLGRAATQARLVTPRAALALVARADSIAPRADQEIAAMVLCARAQLQVALAVPGARAGAERGAAIAGRLGNRRLQASCLHSVAREVSQLGYQDSALALLAHVAALQRQRAAHDRSSLAATLQWRGFLFSSRGHYGEARRILDSAVSEGRASRNQSPVGWASLNLAQLALIFGSADAARAHGAVAESTFARSGDRVGRATLRSVDVGLARLRGDTAAARSALTRALEESSEIGGIWPVSFLRAFAGFHRSIGDWPAAERNLVAARSAARALGMLSYDLGLDYDFGVLALKRGDLSTAERHLKAVLAVTGPEQHSFRYPTLVRLAEVHLGQHRVAEAEAEVVAATDSLDVWRATLDDRRLRLEVFAVRAEDLDPDLGLPAVIAALARAGRDETAFRLAERRRARLLLDRMVKAEAARPPAPGRAPGSAVRTEWRGVSRQEVAAALPDDSTAVLEYVTGDAGAPTTLFVITRRDARTFILPPIDSLAPDIARFSAFIDGRADPGSLGRRLGEALLGPAVAALPASVRRLIVVPDGALHGVPFDALSLEAGRFLLERYAISVVPGAAVLVRLRERPPSTGEVRLLAFGNPLLGGEPSGGEETRTYQAAFDGNGGLPPLEGSAAEVRAVARYADRADVHLGKRASEENLKRAPLEQYRILHFATHALVDDHSAARTALALSATASEDGFVGPADLAARPLSADLVVLSACRSARGVLVGGEGVQGLTAPLLEAGARAVVASAWTVGDRSTPALVRTFYDELALGRSAGDALRAAKLDALARGLPPRSWAAFTLVGDPTLRLPLHAPGGGLPTVALVAGAVALLGLAGLLVLRSKRSRATGR